MADSGTGIQELMAAETRASQIVAEARIGTFYGITHLSAWFGGRIVDQTYFYTFVYNEFLITHYLLNTFHIQILIRILLGRGDRMKQAKIEAQGLISGYRAEKQEEFNNMALSKGGSEGNASAKLQADTNKEIQELQVQFQKNAQSLRAAKATALVQNGLLLMVQITPNCSS